MLIEVSRAPGMDAAQGQLLRLHWEALLQCPRVMAALFEPRYRLASSLGPLCLKRVQVLGLRVDSLEHRSPGEVVALLPQAELLRFRSEFLVYLVAGRGLKA